MASDAVRSKAMVLFLSIRWILLLPLFFLCFFYLFFYLGGGGVLILYCTILTVIFSLNFAIISLRTRGLVALLCVCFCPVAVIDLSLFIAVS